MKAKLASSLIADRPAQSCWWHIGPMPSSKEAWVLTKYTTATQSVANLNNEPNKTKQALKTKSDTRPEPNPVNIKPNKKKVHRLSDFQSSANFRPASGVGGQSDTGSGYYILLSAPPSSFTFELCGEWESFGQPVELIGLLSWREMVLGWSRYIYYLPLNGIQVGEFFVVRVVGPAKRGNSAKLAGLPQGLCVGRDWSRSDCRRFWSFE